MKYFLGIDIGSSSTDVVLLNEERKIVDFGIVRTTPIHKEGALALTGEILKSRNLSINRVSCTVATGYGRNNVPYSDEAITEITCHARGIHYFFPKTRTIIDIGGQDSKVIVCDERGNVVNFAMNDKCAAGSGRFLEVLAGIMNIPLSEIGEYSLASKNDVEINSTCTVFAESEVISKLALGTPAKDILSAVFNTLAKRVYALGKRFGYPSEVAFSGGVAKNIGVANKFENILGTKINIAEKPDIVGAVGAALYALEKEQKWQKTKDTAGEGKQEKQFYHELNELLKKNPLMKKNGK